jgi:hypothetical protein
MRRIVAVLVAALLAAPAVAPGAQDTPAGTPLSVSHSPIACMVAERSPLVEAAITPGDTVQAGRVYFHSDLGDAFYYVEMTPEGGVYEAVLPSPRLEAGAVTYYVEGLGRDFAQSQTAEQRAVVVEAESDCDQRPIAPLGPTGPVRVFSTTGGTALPPGFSGVSSVVVGTGATGAAAAGGVVAGSAATSGGAFVTSTAGIVTAAVAVGVVSALVVSTHGSDNPPASPSN